MTTNQPEDIIEKAARAMAAETYVTPDAWDVWVRDPGTRYSYLRQARAALEAAGVDLQSKPLPVHQVRRQPGTEYAWQKLPQGWRCAQLTRYLTDDDVRSWSIMRVTNQTTEEIA